MDWGKIGENIASTGISGAIGTGLGLLGSIGAARRQKKAIEAQKNAQKELNEQAASLNYEYGEKAAENAYERQLAMYQRSYEDQSYKAMVNQMKDAGLSVGLMYGGNGSGGGAGAMSGAPKGDTGGATAGQAANAAALMEVENQRKSLALQQVSMAKDIQLKDAEIELKEKEADKAGKEALYTEALKETEDALREAKANRECWEGRLPWLNNMRQEFDDTTQPGVDHTMEATDDYYGSHIFSSKGLLSAQKAGEVLKVFAEKGTEEQRKVALAAETALTNEKVKGYWKELEVAIKNADSQAIMATAKKLEAETKRLDVEHKYGIKMTTKQWIELGIGVTGAVAGAVGAGALVKNGMTAAKEIAKKMKGKHVEMTTVEHYGSRGEFKGSTIKSSEKGFKE